MFNKKLALDIKGHTEKLLEVDRSISALTIALNEQIRTSNGMLDILNQLDKKITTLANHLQLEYKNGTYIRKRKK